MEAHKSAFNEQLIFRFDQKYKQNIARTKDQGLQSRVVCDLDSNDDVWSSKTKHFKELSRYPLEDMLACNVDTKFLLCMNVKMFHIECIYFILSVHGGMKYMTSHYSDNGAASCHFVIPITMLLDRINVTALQQYMQQ